MLKYHTYAFYLLLTYLICRLSKSQKVLSTQIKLYQRYKKLLFWPTKPILLCSIITFFEMKKKYFHFKVQDPSET